MAILIQTGGPLGANKFKFDHREGSAMCVAKAILFLSQELFPIAVRRDHELHDEKAYPPNGFANYMPPEPGAAPAEMQEREREEDTLENEEAALLEGADDKVKAVMAQMEAEDE